MKGRSSRIFESPLAYGMIAVAIFYLFFYLRTLPATNIGFADSDELLTVGYHLGVAHPPGYPLYILLLFLFTHLPLGLSVATKGHLLSAFLGSLSLAFVFATCWQIVDYWTRKVVKKSFWSTPGGKLLIAFVSTSFLGASFLFWQYSTITEVFALNNLFVSVIIYLLVLGLLQPEIITAKWWIRLSFLFGLALSHHQTVVLMLPAVLLLMLWNKQQLNIHVLIRMMFTGLVGFLVPFLLLWWFASRGAPVSWHIDPGVNGLMRMIFRQEFSGTLVETGEQTHAYFAQLNWAKLQAALPPYFHLITQYFGWLVVLVVVVGLLTVYAHHKKLFVLILIGYLSTGVALVGMMGWPQHIGQQANNSRQYLLGFMWLPLLLAPGLLLVAHRLMRGLAVLANKQKTSGPILILLLLAVVAWRIKTVNSQINYQTAAITTDFYGQILNQVEPNSLLACFSDTTCFALLYQQTILRTRPDVIILPTAYPLVKDKLDQKPDLHKFAYPANPYLIYDYLTWNIDQRPVYVVDLTSTYYDLLGINNGFLFYVPHGNYGRLVKTMPDQLSRVDQTLGQQLLAVNPPTISQMQVWMKANAARQQVFNSVIYVKAGYRDFARQELNLASNLFYQMPGLENVDAIRKDIEFSNPDIRFKPGAVIPDTQALLDGANQQASNNRLDLAHLLTWGAVTGNPHSVPARLQLAGIYLQMGESEFARQEFLNVLLLDPNNQQAKSALGMFPK